MTRDTWLLVLAVAIIGWILWVPPDGRLQLFVSDSVEYAVAGQRLADGQGLTVKIGGEVHPSRYPFGFPALVLAPVYTVAGDRLGWGVLPVWASALVLVVAVWVLARRILPGRAGTIAGWTAAFAVVQLEAVFALSQQIRPDVPIALLAILALEASIRARAGPAPAGSAPAEAGTGAPAGWGWPLAGGLAVGLAFTMRMTSLVFALPLAFGLLTAGGARARRIAVAGLGVGSSVLAVLIYDQVVFGSPLTTGYHYWLSEIDCRLSMDLELAQRNLAEMVQPFFRLSPAGARGPWQAAGPLAVVGCIGLGVLVRRYRAQVWQRSRGVAFAGVVIALPLVAFHAFYPFPEPRFVVVPHILMMVLGSIWLIALLEGPGRVRRILLIAIAAVVAAGAVVRGEVSPVAAKLPGTDEVYSSHLRPILDRALAKDGVLISEQNPIYLEHFVFRGTTRSYLPLQPRTNYASMRAGPPGARRAFFPFVATEAPEQVGALLRAGRQVFCELPDSWRPESRRAAEAFLEAFETRELRTFQDGSKLLELLRWRAQ